MKMSSKKDSCPVEVELTESSLRITFHQLLPGKKNSKMRTRYGLITNPKFQKIIEAGISDLLCALRSTIQTGGGGTTATLERQLRICSLLPEDDCWEILGETRLLGVKGDAEKIEIELKEMDEKGTV